MDVRLSSPNKVIVEISPREILDLVQRIQLDALPAIIQDKGLFQIIMRVVDEPLAHLRLNQQIGGITTTIGGA